MAPEPCVHPNGCQKPHLCGPITEGRCFLKMEPLTDRPEYVKCVKRTARGVEHQTYCGREIRHIEFVFESADHAAETGLAGGRLVACPACRTVIAAAMAGKRMTEEIEAMARAGYARNIALTWDPARADPPTWETTSEEVREIWREIMRAVISGGL